MAAEQDAHRENLMIPAQIDMIAKRVAQQHALFTQGLTGALARALDQRDPTTARARSELGAEVRSMGHSFVERMTREIDIAIDQLRELGTKDAGVALGHSDWESLREHTDAIKDDATSALVLAAERDANVISTTHRRFALMVDLSQSDYRIGRTTAMIRARFGVIRALRFNQPDRLGRRWDSTVYVEVMLRGYLLHAYVESRLFALARNGVDLIRVDYPDHEHHGMTFSITGNAPGVPSYADVRDEVFHPRSNASIARIE